MQPLTVNFKPSRVLASTLILAGLFAISMVVIVPLTILVKVGLILGVIVSVLLAVRRYAYLQHENAVLSLHVNSLNILHVGFKNDKVVECKVLPTTTVTAYLLIIQLKAAPNSDGEKDALWRTISQKLRICHLLSFFKAQSIVILPDSIAGDHPSDTMRQLRVWLRMASQHDANRLKQKANEY